ncbi:MAG: recombinase family protein [Planctomycetota bacterium]
MSRRSYSPLTSTVSSNSQNTASQEPDLKRWVEAQGDEIGTVKWYVDKASGKTMDRPAWNRLQSDCLGTQFKWKTFLRFCVRFLTIDESMLIFNTTPWRSDARGFRAVSVGPAAAREWAPPHARRSLAADRI